MNIKKIIREEIDDFDWAHETNPYDLLDDYFNLVKTNKGYMIEGIYHKPEDQIEINSIGIILPWTWKDNKTLKRIAYKPAKVVNKIKETTTNELYKIIHNKSVWDWNYFSNMKIAKSLNEWKNNRIEGIFNEYPKSRSCYKHVYGS
jgi:hypothetical protein